MKHFVWRLDFSKFGAWRKSGGNWNRRQLSFDLNFRTQTIVLEGPPDAIGYRCTPDHIQTNSAFWEVCKVTVLGWFVRARREIASLPLSIHTHNGVDSVNIRSVEQWDLRTASPKYVDKWVFKRPQIWWEKLSLHWSPQSLIPQYGPDKQRIESGEFCRSVSPRWSWGIVPIQR